MSLAAGASASCAAGAIAVSVAAAGSGAGSGAAGFFTSSGKICTPDCVRPLSFEPESAVGAGWVFLVLCVVLAWAVPEFSGSTKTGDSSVSYTHLTLPTKA